MRMEGSSASGWQESENAKECETPAASETDMISVHAIRLGVSGDSFSCCQLWKDRNNSSSLPFDLNECVFDPSGSSQFGATDDQCLCRIEGGKVSLRQWLDVSGRSVDAIQCVSIFRQIVEIVSRIHSQGIVFRKLRPSCFAISAFDHVSLIESVFSLDSGSTSSGKGKRVASSEFIYSVAEEPLSESDNLLHNAAPAKNFFAVSQASNWLSSSVPETNLSSEVRINCIKHFEQPCSDRQPMMTKSTLVLENGWYISPEEIAGAPNSTASDIFRLGVLLFELFCPCTSRDEKCTTMASLRHRVLPPHFLLRWPKEVSFCMWLLHPDYASHPQMCEVLESEFLNEARDSSEDCEAYRDLNEKIQEQELLLEFLLLSKQQREESANKLQKCISLLSFDINEVTRLQPSVQGTCSDYPLNISELEGSHSMDFRKRFRLGSLNNAIDGSHNNIDERKFVSPHCSQESMMCKSPSTMKNFKMLESAYFLTRQRAFKKSKNLPNRSSALNNCGRGSTLVNERKSIHEMTQREPLDDDIRSGWISPFLDGLCKYLSCNSLKVKAEVKQGDILNSLNLICALSVDRDGEFFASAGVNNKIKVFEYDSIFNKDRDIHYPAVELVSGSKLSSICWNPYIKSQIASSNFEGVVQLWDVNRNHLLSQLREHDSRVWSVDYSAVDPTLLASGSDDGSVKLWSVNQGMSICTIKEGANVCCVQFPCSSSRTLAFGSADHQIYYYDLRNPRMPLCTLVGHSKTVSYIKFIDSSNLVSASTDGSLKLWDLSSCSTPVLESPTRSFAGHINTKNFVGLSVCNDYIATGSETNEVFIYHKAFPMPALSFKFNTSDPLSGHETDDATQFVSSVCWRSQSSTLIAANSTGNIKILEME